jgi:hypothetical protein
MCPKATLGAFCLLLVSCAQESSIRTSTEVERESVPPISADGKKLVNSAERKKEFEAFWTKFRKDVLSENWSSLNASVVFPLKTRATFDSDPVIDVDAEQFQRVFSAFLAGEDPAHFGKNEATLIRELRTSNSHIIDNWVRIGDMQFTRRDDGWKLYWIYFDAASLHEGEQCGGGNAAALRASP